MRSLCDKVIQHRLTATQTGNNILHRKTNIPIRPDVVTCFCDMTDVIIFSNPTLYTDIALKLNITFQEERLVCKAYSDFAEILFSKGVTWPLIISFLAFSSCLAVECAKHGRSILVRSISDWATIFIIMRLRDWIVQNRCWNGALRYFEPKKQSSSLISERVIGDLMSVYRVYEKTVNRGVFGVFTVCVMYLLYWLLYVIFSNPAS